MSKKRRDKRERKGQGDRVLRDCLPSELHLSLPPLPSSLCIPLTLSSQDFEATAVKFEEEERLASFVRFLSPFPFIETVQGGRGEEE